MQLPILRAHQLVDILLFVVSNGYIKKIPFWTITIIQYHLQTNFFIHYDRRSRKMVETTSSKFVDLYISPIIRKSNLKIDYNERMISILEFVIDFRKDNILLVLIFIVNIFIGIWAWKLQRTIENSFFFCKGTCSQCQTF